MSEQAKSNTAEAPNLIVESRVREFVRDADLRVGSDFTDALNRKVTDLLNDAKRRAESNNRKTLGAGDL